ncbi:hypothetical protein GGX14DRAFT_583347 [Mycena pura]|uniref:Protein phosphatase n=1 Tax=Mycena pura TaxID=153505 RepID=A0AAD7E5X6_9AGAR|nr:hypothetical protein GGX14DRAFT_583347 [Mycena pura]
MKHARFYTALPRVGRVRSNSASRALYTNAPSLASFFDASAPTPPPPNTRLTTHRLPIEARAELEGPNSANNSHPTHAPLALASTHTPSGQHPHPAQLALFFPYPPGPIPKPATAPHAAGSRAHRRRGPRYTLDIGAYGIPKRGHSVRVLHTSPTDAPLAVQVGEDAYFVRENAMGVADGVGGWARVKTSIPPTGPSASALFASRLMHFCADEVDRAAHRSQSHSHSTSSPHPPVVVPWEVPSCRSQRPYAYPSTLQSYPSTCDPPLSSSFPPSSFYNSYAPYSPPASPYDPWQDHYEPSAADAETDDLATALDAELDDLAEGIDVLNILERAYERTLKAHVVPVPPDGAPSCAALPTNPVKSVSPPSTTTPCIPTGTGPWSFLAPPRSDAKTVPLRAGGSTALVAVLDYLPSAAALPDLVEVGVEGAGAGVLDLLDRDTSQHVDTAAAGAALTPVLKIAHLGDCMGMLVRGGTIAWRSEEMWWRWNTPVQLSAAVAGPAARDMAPAAGASGWWGQFTGAAAAPAPADGVGVQVEVTPASAARVFTLPVRAGDILVLASDGLGDNLWDEEVLEEVGRVRAAFAATSTSAAAATPTAVAEEEVGLGIGAAVDGERLRRRTLAGMLSEALCSRARRVATRRAGGQPCARTEAAWGDSSAWCEENANETPFARRARETGREYRGGKNDDISVIVAVIAPAEGSGFGSSASAKREATTPTGASVPRDTTPVPVDA